MSKLFLLSKEEAMKIDSDILACRNWWWLRTKSKYYQGNNVLFVTSGGLIDPYGLVNTCYYAQIRPAVYLKSYNILNNLAITKKGYIKLGTKLNTEPTMPVSPMKWIDISEYIDQPCLLAKKPIEKNAFSNMDKRLLELDNIIFNDEEIKMLMDWQEREK